MNDGKLQIAICVDILNHNGGRRRKNERNERGFCVTNNKYPSLKRSPRKKIRRKTNTAITVTDRNKKYRHHRQIRTKCYMHAQIN